MYAIVKSGGKQYKVQQGDTVRVEKLNAEEGAEVGFDEVLMIADNDDAAVGTPTLEGASVTALVTAHGRGEKVKVVKFKRRKHYHKQMGHRQAYTELRITGIRAQ